MIIIMVMVDRGIGDLEARKLLTSVFPYTSVCQHYSPKPSSFVLVISQMITYESFIALHCIGEVSEVSLPAVRSLTFLTRSLKSHIY